MKFTNKSSTIHMYGWLQTKCSSHEMKNAQLYLLSVETTVTRMTVGDDDDDDDDHANDVSNDLR